VEVTFSKKETFQTRFKTFWKSMKKTKYLHLLALPGVLYYIIFHYIPMYGVIIAFKDYNFRKGILGSEWIGLKHFIRFFENPFFWRLIRNTVLINVYQIIFVFPLPILFALFLNELRDGFYKRFVQTVSYLPHFISLPAIIGMMVMFLSPTDGVVNMILQKMGLPTIYFMADPRWFRPLYIISDIWQHLGWGAIIYIAALSNVNPELYEGAVIDGATRVQMMRYISIPSIMPTIVIMLLLRIGHIMSLGAEKVLLMQSPLNYETSDVISTYVYRRGLVYGEYSYTTAIGFFNSLINLTILIIANKITKRVTETGLF